MRAAAVPFLALILATPSKASDFPTERALVVVGTEISGNWAKAPQCRQGLICMDSPYEGQFRTVRVLAGSGPPKTFNARIWLHARLRKKVAQAFLLSYFENELTVLASNWEPCFDRETVIRAGLAGDSAARVVGANVCFDSPSAR